VFTKSSTATAQCILLHYLLVLLLKGLDDISKLVCSPASLLIASPVACNTANRALPHK
jgi:hypothetical protein